MNKKNFLKACDLRERGKLAEAYQAFRELADETTDALDKAGILVHAAKTLKLQERYSEAERQLRAARELAANDLGQSSSDARIAHLEVYLDYEDADLLWKQGENGEALAKFDQALQKYQKRLQEPDFRDFYEIMQTCRAFILCDLDRWRDAMPTLERLQSATEYREGISFYLGHCYMLAGNLDKAKEKLAESLQLGLPPSLEYRAHCELGMIYYEAQDYLKATKELEQCIQQADPSYIRDSNVWGWLRSACRALGVEEQRDHHGRIRKPS